MKKMRRRKSHWHGPAFSPQVGVRGLIRFFWKRRRILVMRAAPIVAAPSIFWSE